MIHVTKSYLPSIDKYHARLEKIYASGWLTNNGQFVQELTKKLENYLGVKNVLLVTNATIGLQVAYKALGLSGEVITSPFSFVATTSSLAWEHLIPRFVDIDPHSFCLNADYIEAAITQKTSAILPVHVYGNICEVEKIQEIAKAYQLKIVYDAAHAFGVNYKGQSCLNYGDISVLSFHATKLFHTIEGGALIIQDDAVFNKAREMINFGFEVGGPSGHIASLGINGKMSEFHAAMGLCVLEDLPLILQKRQQVDATYRAYLPQSLKTLMINDSATKNYAYFPVCFANEKQLLEVMFLLEKEHVLTRRYFYPALNTLPYLRDKTEVPYAMDIACRVLCLPFYPGLSDEDVIRICQVIKQVVAK